MQCKPVTALPSDEKWTFEIKFDGYRCIAVKRGREVTLFSRHEKVLNKRFPGVATALASLEGDFILDGELLALDFQGRPSFHIMQVAPTQSCTIHFYDLYLLNQNGELIVNLSFSRRRELLESLLGASGAWIKHRTNMEQEFVIGGYIPGTRGFDPLLVGVYENKKLIFVTKVKNGFVPRIRDEVFPALKALQTAQCPFKNLPETRASRWGESLRGENGAMPLGHAEIGLPRRIRRMD
jgi:ATP-dependent DNA ligase